MADPPLVLVVDDTPMVARSTARLLELEGWRAEVAPDGLSALQRVGATPAAFSAVLLDLVLPDLPGPEVFAGLRRLRADLPIVVTSGYGEVAEVGALRHDGAVFLAKPFALDELLRALLLARGPGPSPPG